MTSSIPSTVELIRNASGAVTKRLFRGHEWLNLDDHFPQLRPFFTDYERNYDPEAISQLMKNNNWIPIVSVILYALFIYFGPKYMEKREPFNLRPYLIFWNWGLSIFSFYGVSRVVPWLWHAMRNKSFEELVCTPPEATYGPGTCGLAVQLFVISKLPELIDTVFIVLHKKPCIFLHWYHHITVLLFCWHSYVTESAYGVMFCAMNYSVHAIMYAYYALQAMKKVPKSYPAYNITFIQIAQMFGGTYIVAYAIIYRLYGGAVFKPGECGNVESNLAGGALIYTTYLYLFVEFAFKRFLPGKKKTEKKKE